MKASYDQDVPIYNKNDSKEELRCMEVITKSADTIISGHKPDGLGGVLNPKCEDNIDNSPHSMLISAQRHSAVVLSSKEGLDVAYWIK